MISNVAAPIKQANKTFGVCFLLFFYSGHRVCLGENLAKMEMFVFFAYIIHTFSLRKPNDEPISLKGIGGVTFGPANYEIIAEKRE